MTVHAVITAVKWINQFPSKGGISDTISPSKLLDGIDDPDMSLKRIGFGSYALAYAGTNNNMEERSVPSIALSQSNQTGGNFFMSLDTGKRFHSHGWTEAPVDENIIKLVDGFADVERQPLLVKENLMFSHDIALESDFDEVDEQEMETQINNVVSDRPGQVPAVVNDSSSENDDTGSDSDEDEPESVGNEDVFLRGHDQHDIEDMDEQVENVIPAVSEDDSCDVSVPSDSESGQSDSSDDHVSFVENDAVAIEQNDVDVSQVSDDDVIPLVDDSLIGRLDSLEEEIREDIEESRGLFEEGDSIVDESLSDESEACQEDLPSSRPSRTCSGKGIDRLQMNFESNRYDTKRSVQLLMKAGEQESKRHSNQSYMSRAVNVLLTQMSATEGIKKHGERAIAVLIKEFKQLDSGPMKGKKVIEPLTYSSLTPQEKREALEAINLIKEKRDGSLKGRSCANGAKQKRFLKSDEVFSSPTVSNEAFISTTVIDAVEKRDVATADVPGAYLHAEFPKDKKVILKLTGIFVDIMCRANPEYEKYVAYEKGKKVLYFRVLRALYGCLESALLWYDLYSTTLVKHGFVLNPYDKCVANKYIDGKQCTIVFYVDDNKISHVDPNVVTSIIDILKGHFGELTVSRGKSTIFGHGYYVPR